MFLRTFMFGKSADDWNTYPNRRFSGGTTLPSEAENSVVPMTVICPLSGRERPAMQLSSVVLPLPDGPNTEIAPASNVTSQSRVNCGKRLVMAMWATGAVMAVTRPPGEGSLTAASCGRPAWRPRWRSQWPSAEAPACRRAGSRLSRVPAAGSASCPRCSRQR